MLGYLALNAWMTSSLGGSSFGSPQKDQVIVAAWLLPAPAAAGATVGAGALALVGAGLLASVGAGALALVGAAPLGLGPPWQAASSDAEAAPSAVAVANRKSARRESRVDIGCNPFIH